jgi:hypothetical protein
MGYVITRLECMAAEARSSSEEVLKGTNYSITLLHVDASLS